MKTRASIRGLATMAGRLLMVALVLCVGSAIAATTERVSVDSEGNEANYVHEGSNNSAISGDGRYVAFDSPADNLVADDTNLTHDVFVHDRLTSQTMRVSVATDGGQALSRSERPAISADGNHVAFYSGAWNLVPDDTNWEKDIFVHERETGTTARVNLASDGSQANDLSYLPGISADGRFVTYVSYADNLVPDDINQCGDVFVRDRLLGETRRVSVASDGTEANALSEGKAISCDGGSIAFQSYATNLVLGDTNDMADAFVHDLETGITTRVSVASDGSEADSHAHEPAVSCDGRYIAFSSSATNLVPDDTNGTSDIFVHDRETHETTRVNLDSEGNETHGHAFHPSFSGNGRYVAFTSYADDVVIGDTNEVSDIFVHDRETGATVRASVDSNDNEGNWRSWHPSLSADGRYVAFTSEANNLVLYDTNQFEDIFVRGPLFETQTLIVDIDIAWQRYPNQLNPAAGKLQVAVLTTESFDAADVDTEAPLWFGPAEVGPVVSRMRDFDSDGDEDLLLFFETASTGIACGDTEATLNGQTIDGQLFEGTDTVVPVACH